MTDRYVDTDSRAYRTGVADANALLDRSPEQAEQALQAAQWVAQRAHEREDNYLYTMAKGTIDTLREYFQERSS